jgi:membrane-bound lytic murein transglycosylase B
MNFNLPYKSIAGLKFGLLLCSTFILTSARISYSSSNIELTKVEIFKPVADTLIKMGVDSAFIYGLINDEHISFNEGFVKINVVGSGRKADYSSHYNDRAVSKSKEFLDENDAVLQLAENKYGVPKEVITAILYVETRHGNYLGSNNIVSVFLSTALASQPEYIEMNAQALKETYSDNSEALEKYLEKLTSRAEYKTGWALEQLQALEELNKVSPLPITEIEGSWAGAFGMSQFLPSSYISWAVDGNGDGEINLFDKEDAIFSVANYLSSNGWGTSLEKQKKAIWHYNHSSAYVNAVLKLSELISV